MLEHGGRLKAAARRYGIAETDWLDLSTGIAPYGWALPEIPATAWTRLPERDDGLEEAARGYYGAASLLPVAGSQAAIQALPRLRAASRVGVVAPCYAEHAHAWQREGHEVVALRSDEVEQALDRLDVLLVVNPNNPTGERLARERLLAWHGRLVARGGWLLVDEAFMDCTPEHSLCGSTPAPGLVVLRSFGKFFGLAGIRLGFVLADPALLQRLEEQLGPWAVSGPARALARTLLADGAGQVRQRLALLRDGARLERLLGECGLAPAGGTALFQRLLREDAARLHDYLAARGILTRLFMQPASLRFGLPPDESGWRRLCAALIDYAKDHS